jgi:tRNA A37 threonylcarbamoyladenosine modification protein TsaB
MNSGREEELVLSVYADGRNGYVAAKVGMDKYPAQCAWARNATPTMCFPPLIQQLIADASINLCDAKVIIAPKGPAPFTIQRVLSTVARSMEFCAPGTTIFSPSNFHVLAHAVKNSVKEFQNFMVIIDAYNQGFYGAIFQNHNDSPKMLPGASFYDRDTGVDFLRCHENIPFVTDFSQQNTENVLFHYISPEDQLAFPQENLALVQIDLFDAAKDRTDFDYRSLQPYRLHTPVYRAYDHSLAR